MANFYKWTINQMNARIEEDGNQNVIYTVHWTYTAQDDQDPQYTASQIGTYSLQYDPSTPFIPYADDEAFENVVISWLKDGLDVNEMEANLSHQIDLEKHPVDEDLYFTWDNPPAPPPIDENVEEE